VTLLWKPTENLSVTPSFFHETSTQNGISAYDSVPGTEAHYQPFDIAEPLTDSLTAYSLNVNYSFPAFDLTSSTAQWTRNSSQVEEASEAFNNPLEGITYNSNYGLANPGYYGATGSGPEHGIEDDPSHQFSEELRLASTGNARASWVAGLYYSDFYSLWGFNGYDAQLLLVYGSGHARAGNHTQLVRCLFAHHAQAVCGLRRRHLCPDRCAQGRCRRPRESLRLSLLFLPQRLGIGQRSRHALVFRTHRLSSTSFNPKFNLTYTFSPDLMAYATVSTGFRPGGGNAAIRPPAPPGEGFPAAGLYERQVARHVRTGPCL
jgi:iron complex outermembrane recepter protein